MSESAENVLGMDIHGILEHLPHRYPFLLVDRVLECKAGESLVGIKNVTYNEPQFTGHFPHRPVMPGVLILEAMAQCTGILAFVTMKEKPDSDSLYYFVGIDNARFKKPVEPGDQIRMEVKVLRQMRGIWRFSASATVGDEVVCEAELMCAKRNVK